MGCHILVTVRRRLCKARARKRSRRKKSVARVSLNSISLTASSLALGINMPAGQQSSCIHAFFLYIKRETLPR